MLLLGPALKACLVIIRCRCHPGAVPLVLSGVLGGNPSEQRGVGKQRSAGARPRVGAWGVGVGRSPSLGSPTRCALRLIALDEGWL